ncbi:MAG: PKD domain-containing protein [Bacteroidales bacterium]|nr:PKD domain-containing protein [Bacteroidales bacterium]MCF8402877.1 PKD domain-containing protein [Bacteroidales bacterium]
MKKILLNLAIVSLIFGGQIMAQNRKVSQQIEKQKPNTQKIKKLHSGRYDSQIIAQSATSFKKLEDDTLNFPLAGEYSIYLTDFGYVSGNNEYEDQVKANYFNYGQTAFLTGVLFDFAVATNSGIPIEIGVWDNAGANGSPGSKIGSSLVNLDDIFIDVLNEQMTYIAFEVPVQTTAEFYVGAVLPQSPGDTLVVFSNTDGDTDPATAWDLWSTGDWFPYDDPDNWELKVAHAIFPIVSSEIDLTANFSASPLTLTPGQEVQFTDLSVGGPVNWLWTFEGGDPAQSNDMNPTVAYAATGEFDVTLIVGLGADFDTITKVNYISVVEEIPPDVDTLLFPLPGNYVIFTIIGDGGYVCGTNGYGDLAKANYFYNNQELKITGVLYDFAWADGGNPNLELAVWDDNGPSHSPGTKLQSQMISLNAIKEDISNQAMTYIELNPPIITSEPFYTGFYVPQSGGDTIVCWSNDHFDINPGIAWDLFEDNTWHPFNEQGNWELEIAMAIHPIVEYITGIENNQISESIQINPNPGSGMITINTGKFIGKEVELEIFDSKGLSVKSNDKFFVANSTTKIDLGDQSPGLYFIKLSFEGKNYMQKYLKK